MLTKCSAFWRQFPIVDTFEINDHGRPLALVRGQSGCRGGLVGCWDHVFFNFTAKEIAHVQYMYMHTCTYMHMYMQYTISYCISQTHLPYMECHIQLSWLQGCVPVHLSLLWLCTFQPRRLGQYANHACTCTCMYCSKLNFDPEHQDQNVLISILSWPSELECAQGKGAQAHTPVIMTAVCTWGHSM